MTSAYLLFPVKKTTGEFFRRRFARIVIPFAVWAALYVGWFGSGPDSWEKLLFNFPDEGGHLWFVPMLLGLYILMPLLSPWAEKVESKELKGWILLWLVTTSFPFLRRLWGSLFGEPPFGAVPYLWGECPWNAFGTFHYASGFVGYVLLGLWFRKFAPRLDLRRALRIAVPVWLAGAGVMGIPFFFFARSFPVSAPYQSAVVMETSIEYCSTGVALTTFALFLCFRTIDFAGWLYRKVVQPISEASYGMYLLHMFILPTAFTLLRPHLPTPLAILATAAATFSSSAVVAILIRRIPAVGKRLCGLGLTFALLAGCLQPNAAQRQDDFVQVAEAVPDVIQEIRYYSTYNFVGERIDGYERPQAMITRKAARALKAASDECVRRGYRLKIYDAYRPQRAVMHFMRWAKDIEDTRMKAHFYPNLDKSVLFSQGYIAERSGHSRGSTVDLTLFDMKTGKELDMGGTFDWFGKESHPDYKGITKEQFSNRMLLREIMQAHGFKPIAEEWWHFTLADEPYPDTYFDFPVR